MKNSKLLLALLTLAACQDKKPALLLSQWEKSAESQSFIERKLASGPQGQCLKDNFTVEVLKNEIRELEKKFANAPRVSGQWKHLNLERLPVPQANFLKTYGSKIGDLKTDSIDYSTCSDVPCLFNKIYGEEDGKPGYVHYLWYLKFGFMLSADNMLPDQASKTAGVFKETEFSLDKYLLKEKELYALWRLSIMMKPPFTNLSYLKEMQKVPRGQDFESEDDAGACGLAFSGGWIMLTDGCMTVYDHQWDQGYLYQAVSHEIAHHVDFEQGRGSREFYRSYKPDYLEISGFFLKEYADPSTGKMVRQWDMKAGSKLPSSYAGTAPQENFAEALALFRVEGDKTKSAITDKHYGFVSTNYFDGNTFEFETLIKNWMVKYNQDISRAAFKAVVDCAQSTKPEKSAYFSSKDFAFPVLPSILNCIGSRALEISSMLKAKTTLYEPEGCLAANDFKTKPKWDPIIKDAIKPLFSVHLENLNKDKNYLDRIKLYQEQLADKTMAREAYLHCYNESDEALCFQDEILKRATDKALSLNLPEVQTKEMAEMYVSYHSFETTKNEVKRAYREIAFANLELIRKEAIKTWQSCEQMNHSDDQTPTGSHFQLADGYMISSFYNCLNVVIPEAVQETVRIISVEGVKLQHAKEEMMLLREVQPEFIKILKDRYDVVRSAEKSRATKVIEEDKGQIRKKLLSDFSWVKNVIDTEEIQKDCVKEGLRLVPMLPLYELKRTLFGDYIAKNSCLNVTATHEFNTWLDSSKGDLMNKVMSGVEGNIIAAAEARAQHCLKQYPIDSALNKIRWKKQREACLVDEWPKLESAVLDLAVKDPVAIKFQVSRDVLRVKLEASRRRLQLRIIKERFQ